MTVTYVWPVMTSPMGAMEAMDVDDAVDAAVARLRAAAALRPPASGAAAAAQRPPEDWQTLAAWRQLTEAPISTAPPPAAASAPAADDGMLLDDDGASDAPAALPGPAPTARDRPCVLVLDTNYLLAHLDWIGQVLRLAAATPDVAVLVPWVVLEELDTLKVRRRQGNSPVTPLRSSVTGCPRVPMTVRRPRQHATPGMAAAALGDAGLAAGGRRPPLAHLARSAVRALFDWLTDPELPLRGQRLDEIPSADKVWAPRVGRLRAPLPLKPDAAAPPLPCARPQIQIRQVSNDDRVLACCLYFAQTHRVALLSNDQNLGVKAMVHGVPCFNTRNMPDDVIAVLRRIAPAPLANGAAPVHASGIRAPPPPAAAAVAAAAGPAPAPASIPPPRRPEPPAAAAADPAVGDLDSLSAPSDVVSAWMRRASPEKPRPARAAAPPTAASLPDISADASGVARLASILERWIAPAAERLLRRELGEVRCLAGAAGGHAFVVCSPDPCGLRCSRPAGL